MTNFATDAEVTADLFQATDTEDREMGLADLFEHALKDMYYSEQEIYKALSIIIRAAQDPALKDALSSHREETSEHIELLEEVFEDLGKEPEADPCDAIDGILAEANALIGIFNASKAVDAAIVFSAQAVEHYKITRYGSMHAFAIALRMDRAAERISYILDQEMAADETLATLADITLNAAAA